MKPLNILFSVDSLFLEPLKVLLFSLYETQSSPINIYFFNSSLNSMELRDLENFCKSLSFKIFFYELPSSFKNALKVQEISLKRNKLAVETYSRLLAPSLLSFLDRILWLDADCLVQKDLKDFYFQDLGGNFIAACDHAAWDIRGLSPVLFPRKPKGEHFNAGVVLFDLQKCRKIKGFQPGILEKMIPIPAPNFDQTILNELFKGRVLYCDPLKYNMFLNQNWPHSLHNHPIQYKLYREAVILHYCCPEKPWDIPCVLDYEKAKYWLDTRNRLAQNIEGRNGNLCRK